MSTETAPETVADSPEATLSELAKPDDASLYIEQRREDDKAKLPPKEDEPKADPEFKKASRYERLKKARDAYKAEADELRAKYESPTPQTEQPAEPQQFDAQKLDAGSLENQLRFAADKHGGAKFKQSYDAFAQYVQQTGDKAAYDKVMSAPDVGEALIEWFDRGEHIQGAVEHGRQQQEAQQFLAQRDEQIRVDTEVKLRTEAFAKTVPDFYEVIESINEVPIPPLMLEMIKRSPLAPQIAYALGRDAFESGIIWNLESLANDPIAQAREFGRIEAAIQMNVGQPAPQRTTKAPPPIKPIQGGASAPKDLHELAKQDTADAYIKARRQNA
jgi:hypothetical protein